MKAFSINIAIGLLWVLCGYGLSAQQLEVVTGKTIIRDVPTVGRQGHVTPPSTHAPNVCGPDILAYTLNKSSNLRVVNVNGLNSAAAIGQYYEAPQPVSVSGVRFYAFRLNANMGTTSNVVVELYNARPDSLPLGAPLATTTVAVDTNFYGGYLSALEKIAYFTSPVTVSGPYVVVIRNNSAIPIGLVTNDFLSLDGQGEWLATAQINGWWQHGYMMNTTTAGFNCDALIDPVVTYSLRANFTSNPSCIIAPGTATFTNTSSPILRSRMYNVAAFQQNGGQSVTWNFGDGSGTIRQSVGYDTTHYYAAAGSYAVTLADTIYGWTMSHGTDTTIVLGQSPVAQYTYTANDLAVSFSNQTTNAMMWCVWDFGDGTVSNAWNPQHVYASSGTYTVCLTSTNTCGTDVECMTVTVTCPSPTTAFSSYISNLDVDFTDLTTGGGIQSWVWSFGDGSTSILQNPTHTFAAPGNYLVCLTTANHCGHDSACYWITVTCPAPVADFSMSNSGLTVSFTNTSTGGWSGGCAWDFGDGATSTDLHPTHTYASPGNYQVCLVNTNDCSSDDECKSIELLPAVAVGSALAGTSIQISPNPANGHAKVVIALPAEYNVELSVYNLLGGHVRTIHLGLVHSTTVELDVQDLAAGNYLVRVATSSGAVSKRLDVMH